MNFRKLVKRLFVLGVMISVSCMGKVSAKDGEVELIRAAALGDVELIEELVNQGINVNCRAGEGGRTPLMTAVENGQILAQQRLRELGAIG